MLRVCGAVCLDSPVLCFHSGRLVKSCMLRCMFVLPRYFRLEASDKLVALCSDLATEIVLSVYYL